jgi:hypothetical protein
MELPKFNKGDQFYCQMLDKTGTVRNLRDDGYERKNRTNKDPYHYYVDFDDRTFETYLSETWMKKLLKSCCK